MDMLATAVLVVSALNGMFLLIDNIRKNKKK